LSVYTVVLAMTLNGASIGSTNDVFEAASAVEAEVQAIAAWRRPSRRSPSIRCWSSSGTDSARGARTAACTSSAHPR
jgi:hypothetical protein